MNYYLFESGAIRGVEGGRTPGVAFRKLMKIGYTKDDFGALARFKEVDSRGRNVLVYRGEGKRKRATWLYQDPEALLKS